MPLALDTGGLWFGAFAIQDVPAAVILDYQGNVLAKAGTAQELEERLTELVKVQTD